MPQIKWLIWCLNIKSLLIQLFIPFNFTLNAAVTYKNYVHFYHKTIWFLGFENSCILGTKQQWLCSCSIQSSSKIGGSKSCSGSCSRVPSTWRTGTASIKHYTVGFEYWTSLVFKWPKIGWMPNGLVFKCHLNTGEPNHFNTRQMEAIMLFYVLVQYSNGHYSTWDITHRPTIWILDHLKFELKKFRYSNVSSIQMVSIQIPNVQ